MDGPRATDMCPGSTPISSEWFGIDSEEFIGDASPGDEHVKLGRAHGPSGLRRSDLTREAPGRVARRAARRPSLFVCRRRSWRDPRDGPIERVLQIVRAPEE